MNLFISSDIEGTCGIAAWSETEPGRPDGDYAYFKQQMSREVAAACRGALAAGGERILVKDAHDSARNIQHGDWDAAVFTGYHAAACCDGNPLSHTMNTSVDYVEINGVRASEFTLNAYMAGYHGVPVCFVSGDAALCDSARRMIPDIATVPGKKGDGNSATSLHPALAVKRIEETLRAQLESGAYRTCIVPMPPKFEIIIRYKEHRAAYRCSFYPGVEQVDEKTLRFTCVDYMDAMCLFQFVL